MKYPKKLIEKLKAGFPLLARFIDILAKDTTDRESCLVVIGLLESASTFKMSANQILAAFEAGRQDDVKMAAETAVCRQRLYAEACQFFGERGS